MRVQRGKVLRIDRPDGRKVLKFDGAFGLEGCGIALRAMSFIMLPAASSASFGGSPSRNDTVRNEETIPSAMRRGDLSTQSIMGAVPVCLP